MTGGAGFIGSHLVEHLVKHDKKVIVLDNFVSGKMENIEEFLVYPDCELIEGSITDSKLIDVLVKDVDVVFNEAASKCTVCYDNPTLDMMVNGIGTLNVVQACDKYNKKLVHASSGSVMDGRPNSFYGISKWAGENYIRQYDKEYKIDQNNIILRYYHVYGTRQDSNDTGGVIPIFIRNIYNNKPIVIFGSGEQVRHFTSVYDVINANMAVINHTPQTKYLYNVVSNVKVTINDLALMIYDIMGKQPDIRNDIPKRGDIFKFPDIYDNQIQIGYIDNFRKELERTVDWYIRKFKAEEQAYE